jgi:hypothetical protein
VLNGLLRIGFEHHQQIIWDKGRTILTRTLYWFQHEPCWFVRKRNAPWYGKAGENSTIWAAASPKFIRGGKHSVIVNGVGGVQYEFAGGIVFSPDSKRVAYVAIRGDESFVVVDGVAGKTYEIFLPGGLVFDSPSRLHALVGRGLNGARQFQTLAGRGAELLRVEINF